jgi:hypothetical protein
MTAVEYERGYYEIEEDKEIYNDQYDPMFKENIKSFDNFSFSSKPNDLIN